jgi:hypothetical protein
MGTFAVINSTLNSSYTYTDESVVVNGSYQKDAQNDTLQSISGSVYHKTESGEQGEYIGNFNGYQREDGIRYSLSEMTRRDNNLVWNAIDGIEPHVLPQTAEEGGAA